MEKTRHFIVDTPVGQLAIYAKHDKTDCAADYREGISKDRLSALRAQYPDIYDEFVDQTESRIFKVVKSAIA